MTDGIYEELVTQMILQKINALDKKTFYVNKSIIDKAEASSILANHLSNTIKKALNQIKGENQIEHQIKITNKVIKILNEEIKQNDFDDDLIAIEGKILKAVFTKVNSHIPNFDLYLKEITPYTRLTQSELFTGGNIGLSLESELKKEILSSNRIDLLVSFIKFKGIIILEKALHEFTNRGGELRVITTTYMGASDYKAIQLLSKLENTQIKISYNTRNERLHAKAYLFYRNTGFHTGYIGSSNFSRSALTDGLEWNVKITTKEVSHIIDKFQKTFDSYWQSSDFEMFDDNIHKEKLIASLSQGKSPIFNEFNSTFFDIKPYPFQNEVLEKLEVERNLHNRNRNLIVAATGTGKTIISAFDYKIFKSNNKSAKLLFLSHKKEILLQSLSTFRGVLKDNNFGSIWVDGHFPKSFDFLFASVQSFNNQFDLVNLSPEYFDYIVVDECHHMTAKSYRGIINYFNPKIFLGLTATPERMDGGDIKQDFHNKIAAEIRLPEALNRKLLSPFQYFGITDNVDLSNISWEKGRYSTNELTNIYTTNNRRVSHIIATLNKYTRDLNDVRALGFCVSIEHAKFMSDAFNHAQLKAAFLTSSNTINRDSIMYNIKNKEINYLFVVDIFNEGIDIPEIDTVLFLRPTESLTIFLQQLGRGLRLAENKECLTVLDFVGNSRPEYNFESKFRALIGKSPNTIIKEIEDNFAYLPLGCSIILEPKAKEIILKNIRNATAIRKNQIINKIKLFEHNSSLQLSLKNFIEFYNIPLPMLYRHGSWKRLCNLAGKLDDFECANEKEIVSTILKKWLSTNSISYFQFILKLAKNSFSIINCNCNENERKMLLMLHYDIWKSSKTFKTIEQSMSQIGKNRELTEEIVELLEILIDRIDFKEIEINLPYHQPLRVHSRYTRDQILAAFELSTFNQKSTNREGVAENTRLNTELLFINLIKSNENFSPTTMYDDYAISETLFHWQSQNAAGPNTSKGKSYIEHIGNSKIILLFVREKSNDDFGNRMGFVFIGQGFLKEHSGNKPMNIKWKLSEPMPNYLWKDAAKLSIS